MVRQDMMMMVTKSRDLEHKGPKVEPRRYVRTLTGSHEGGTTGRRGRLISKEWTRTLRRNRQVTPANDTERRSSRWYETPNHRHGKVVTIRRYMRKAVTGNRQRRDGTFPPTTTIMVTVPPTLGKVAKETGSHTRRADAPQAKTALSGVRTAEQSPHKGSARGGAGAHDGSGPAKEGSM